MSSTRHCFPVKSESFIWTCPLQTDYILGSKRASDNVRHPASSKEKAGG
jgi:hypothetical protein